MSKRIVTLTIVIAAALAASGCVLFKRCPGSASCPVQPADPNFAQSSAQSSASAPAAHGR